MVVVSETLMAFHECVFSRDLTYRLLTMIQRRYVDVFGSERALMGKHLKPQFVAIPPYILDGAGLLLGSDGKTVRPQLSNFLTLFLSLLHHITG